MKSSSSKEGLNQGVRGFHFHPQMGILFRFRSGMGYRYGKYNRILARRQSSFRLLKTHGTTSLRQNIVAQALFKPFTFYNSKLQLSEDNVDKSIGNAVVKAQPIFTLVQFSPCGTYLVNVCSMQVIFGHCFRFTGYQKPHAV